MNPMTKIVLGALATTAVAWWLHGPMHFGEKCAAAASATAPAAEAPVAAGVPATAEAVASCQTKVNAAIAGKTINFTSGGANIAVDSQPLIDAIATDLKDCAGTTVEVQGHTDSTGGDAANQRLSEARANSVVQALVDKGVPTDRLSPKGFGETQPLDPAATPAAYAKNRRIEFKVSATGAAPAAPAAGQ
jgi:outer membrane protein OmpA-like peptidoglycan-associated protein